MNLLKAGASVAAIRIVNRFLALALSVVFARLLGVEGYGIYAYAFALLSLTLIVTELGVPTILMRDAASAQENNAWSKFKGNVIQGAVICAIAILLVAAIFLSFSGPDESEKSATIALMLVVVPFMVFTKFFSFSLRGIGAVLSSQAGELLIRPLVALVIFSVLVFAVSAEPSPSLAMLSQITGAAAAIFFVLFMFFRKVPEGFGSSPAEYDLRRLGGSMLPLTFVGGAGVINSQADLLMLNWYLGSAEVGVYRVAVQGGALAVFGLQVINIVAAPRFSAMFSSGKTEDIRCLAVMAARISTAVAIVVSLLFLFGGEAFINLLFGSDFVAAYVPLIILCAAQIANAVAGSVGFLLTMTGHERICANSLAFSAVLNIVLNMTFIPLFGVPGAAAASGISLVSWNVMLSIGVRRELGFNASIFGSKKIG